MGAVAMKVLLVDDHPLILQALQTVISTMGDDVTVVGMDNADEALAALAHDADFDLVLLDLNLGDVDGFGVLARMRQDYPNLPVVVVSATDSSVDVMRVIDMGAMGFVPKRSSNRELFEALAMVMNGAVYVPPAMLGLMQRRVDYVAQDTVPSVMRSAAQTQPMPGADPAAAASAAPAGTTWASQTAAEAGQAIASLTPRQTEVLALLLKGLPNKLIARELNVSTETVKDHVAAVLRALNVNSRTQAVLAVSAMTQAGAFVVNPAGSTGPAGFSIFRPSQR